MLIVPLLQYIVTTYQLVLFSSHDSSQGKECMTHSEPPPTKMWGRSATHSGEEQFSRAQKEVKTSACTFLCHRRTYTILPSKSQLHQQHIESKT